MHDLEEESLTSGVPRQVLRVLEHPHHKESSRSIGITPVLLELLARYTSTCNGTTSS